MPSLPALFLDAAGKSPESIAFFEQNRKGEWESMSRLQTLQRVGGMARRLYAFGVTSGSRVAILSETRSEWAILDMAIMSLGATVVGLYPGLTPDQICHQLSLAEVSVLIIDHERRYPALENGLDDVDDLIHILSIDESEALLPLTPAEYDAEWFADQVARVSAQSPAAIVFSSGTTGESKGVVLSHQNFISNLYATQSAYPLPPKQRAIVCLPLAHVLQRFALYRGLIEDVVGYFCALDNMAAAFQTARPTVMTAVPRMLEKIIERAEGQASTKGPLSHALFKWALAVAGSTNKKRIQIQRPLANALVLKKIRWALGDSLECIICGGAPLKVSTARFFEAFGVDVVQGWGLTETAAPATLTPFGQSFDGSVGPALPNTMLKIAEDGEVLVKGDGVFSGYLNAPTLNRQSFTDGGYFRTGDLGRIDSKGSLWIIGRKKELIITAGGKNIAPFRVRQFMEGGVIAHVLVIGNERPFLSALIALDADFLAEFVQRQGGADENDSWHLHPEIVAAVSRQVERGNMQLAPFEQIKKHAILPHPLTVDNGGLTPTLKLRTAALIQKHQARIAAFY